MVLYEALGHLTSNPVVALNRAVAVSMASGPAAGLEIADALTEHGARRSDAQCPRAKRVA